MSHHSIKHRSIVSSSPTPLTSLSVGQNCSGVGFLSHRPYIPALEGQGFPAIPDKICRDRRIESAPSNLQTWQISYES
jgi:hypothetical protein